MHGPPIPVALGALLLTLALGWASRTVVERTRLTSSRWHTRSAGQRRLLASLPALVVVVLMYAVIFLIFGW